ncbi:MAG: VWA domain-containing protein [Calditrichaeota bacterium]|nr:MAG: VWA domain-containing protein [Calditrichota bacterium]
MTRKTTQNPNLPRLLIFAFLIFFGTSIPDSEANDSLKVTVNNPVIDGSLTIRGVTGSFPTSLLSTISVTDSAGNAVTGLADTSKWLAPDDFALNGRQIKDIWQPMLEYHKEHPDYPENPNIYEQIPAPRILEIQQNEHSSSSAMMVMDMSWSMRLAIDSVRAATKLFVDSLGQGDRAGLIQFHGDIGTVINFTNDKNRLYAGIDGGKAGGGTPLADALGLAIQMTKEETTARRVIIAYTDGHDKDSKEYTIPTVIDSARAYNIPIYMIGLGAEIHADTLQMLATETGGEYLQSGSAADMAAIYARLSEVIRNYYVLNYSSPDPFYNNSERLIDVNVNDNNRTGHGMGRYFVPGPAATDFAISLTSATSDTAQEGGQTFNAAYKDSTIDYTIIVFNHGPNPSINVRVTHKLPVETEFIATNKPTETNENNTLIWRIPGMLPGDIQIFNVSARVRSNLANGTKDMLSEAEVFAVNDSTATNNNATTTVKYLGSYPRYDGALAMPIVTPGKISAGGFEFGRVSQNETYSYSLKIFNYGNQTLVGATLRNWIPDSVKIQSISTQPASDLGSELIWNLPAIQAEDSLIIQVTAQLADSMPVGSFPLPHKAELEALADEEPENNIAEETIYAVILKQNSDLALSLSSQTDSTIAGRNAVTPEEIFNYTLMVNNNGPGHADDVKVKHVLPNYVTFAEGDIAGHSENEWHLGTILAGKGKSINMLVKTKLIIPDAVKELISQAELISPIDTVSWNNTAADTVTFIPIPLAELQKYDLSIDTEILTDTTIFISGEEQPAARLGSVYRYTLKISNSGPGEAKNFQVLNTLPENASHFQLSKQAGFSTLADLAWDIPSLKAGEQEKIVFYARVDNQVPQTPFALENRAEVVSKKDTVAENNISLSTVYAVEGDKFFSDIAVRNFVQGTSFTFTDNDTIWFADENSTYNYAIQIENNSKIFADSIFVSEYLPDGATPVASTYLPNPNITGDPVQWFFEAIEPNGTRVILFDMAVPSASDNAVRLFTHKAEARAANEQEDDLSDNTDTALIYSVVEIPEPEIAVSPQTVLVGDSVLVRVRTSIELKSWDLRVFTADNQIDDTFADAFIAASTLEPGQWFDVSPFFRNTRLFTAAKEEVIRFELHTVDFLNNSKRVSTNLTVRARDDMVLERNVFRAGRESKFGINFELSSNRNVILELYDLSGTLITIIEEGAYLAGHNTYYWNGITKSGQQVGSGVYLVTLRSGDFTSWKKMVVVQ